MLQIEGWLYSHPPHNCRAASQTALPADGEFKLKFSDQTQFCYQVKDLKKLQFFNTFFEKQWKETGERELTLEYSHDEFELILNLLVEEKPFLELLDSVNLTPEFFESITCSLTFFHPTEQTNRLIEEIKEQLAFVSPETAFNILQQYQPQCENELPVCVARCRKIAMQAFYFPIPVEATNHFRRIRTVLIDQVKANSLLTKVEFLFQSTQDAFRKKCLQPHLTYLTQTLAENQQTLAQLKARIEPRLANQAKMVKHMDRLPEFARAVAMTAQVKYDTHKQLILQTLQKIGADCSRLDLIDGFIELLEHYGIRVMAPSHFMHHAITTPLQYFLSEASLWDLEEKMRKDLRLISVKQLPPRLITERIVTKPVSEEIKVLAGKIVPIIKNWKSCSDPEVDFVKNQLIHINQWGQFGIQPKDFGLNTEISNPSSGIHLGTFRRPSEIPLELDIATLEISINHNRSNPAGQLMTTREWLCAQKADHTL